MKSLFIVSGLLAFITASAQQTLVSYRGVEIPIELLSRDSDTIHYKNLKSGKQEKIAKIATWKIRNANGSADYFFSDAENTMSIDDVKTKVTQLINEFSILEKARRYDVSFDGNHLRRSVIAGQKKKDKGILFYFGQVYAFLPVKKLNDEISLIEVFVDFYNPKEHIWEKRLFDLRIKGHENAQQTLRALQLLHHKLTS